MTYTAEKTEIINITCPRCNGRGTLPEFAHIKGGACFLCGGAKTINSTFKYQADRKFKPPIVEFIKAANHNCKDAIQVWFDSKYGYGAQIIETVNEENKLEMRELWKFFKNNGAIMQTR